MNRRPLAALAFSLALLAVAHADENPFAKSKVGEWIIQKNVISGTMTTIDYVFVSKVDGKKVTLGRQVLNNDAKTANGPVRYAQPIDTEKPLPASKDEKKLGDEEVELKGKKMKCKKVESTAADSRGDKMTTTTWTSSEIPLYGTVRQIVKDKDGKELLRMDLLDWGAEGGKERPVTGEQKTDNKDKTEKK